MNFALSEFALSEDPVYIWIFRWKYHFKINYLKSYFLERLRCQRTRFLSFCEKIISKNVAKLIFVQPSIGVFNGVAVGFGPKGIPGRIRTVWIKSVVILSSLPACIYHWFNAWKKWFLIARNVTKASKRITRYTPPILAIICAKNVGAKVVCGFFMKL